MGDRVKREAQRVQERMRRKAQELEEQERWLVAEAEMSRQKARDQEHARKRRLEDEADSSMMLLDKLAGQQQQQQQQQRAITAYAEPVRQRDRGDRRNGLSRSRSVSAKSPSPEPVRIDYRARDKKRKRSRSDRRKPGANAFHDALRRRMAEREANDTTRIPIVDPGHAQRWK